MLKFLQAHPAQPVRYSVSFLSSLTCPSDTGCMATGTGKVGANPSGPIVISGSAATGLGTSALSELRLDGSAGITLFAREGTGLIEVRLGSGDFSLKLHKLAQVRAALARRGERAARIDLDNQSRPEWVSAQLTSQR